MHSLGTETVGQLARDNPLRTIVFEAHKIDYCCGGNQTLEQACGAVGLSVDAIAAELEAAPPSDERDWSNEPMGKLIDHIVGRHHTYVRSTLPSMDTKLVKLIEVHSEPTLALLRRLLHVVQQLQAELTEHMYKEEMILFPYIQAMESADADGARLPPAPGGSVGNPIHMMEHEHAEAGAALKTLRELTDDYTLPGDACNTFAALYAQLQEFEKDLHRHIHLENNILFPHAVALEQKHVSKSN